MAKLTLTSFQSGYLLVSALNANNALIEAALENTLSRDGLAPNAMGADLDMNSFEIVNAGVATSGGAYPTLQQVTDLINAASDPITSATAALVSVLDVGGFYVGTDVEAVLQELPGLFGLLTGDANVTGQWDFDNIGGIRILDGGGVNLIQIRHDTTDVNLDFVGATDLNINDGVTMKLFNTVGDRSIHTDVEVTTANVVATTFSGLGGNGAWDIECQNANLAFGVRFKGDVTVFSSNLGFLIADSVGGNLVRLDNTGVGLDVIGSIPWTFGSGVAVTINDNLTIGDAISMSAVAYMQHRGATSAQLDDILNAVNTAADKIQGAQIYNTTTDNPVYAVGSADGDIWVDGVGATVHTPV